MSKKERLNRFLARAGVASRRASDRLIQTGQVEVNGERICHPGTLIDPDADRVTVEGKQARPPAGQTYVLLNKPPGYLVSAKDPHHSRTVYDLLNTVEARVFPVGRLDLDTRGVLLLTDDGDLAHRLTHPRFGVEKTYRARVKGRPGREAVRNLRQGVALDDGPTASAEVDVVSSGSPSSMLEITLKEGRKRQVKRMCEAVGHPVLQLERVAFAGITADGLREGRWRLLLDTEVARLRREIGLGGGE
jgi:23S rRNA pseudouridine2605 synthase